MWFDAVKAQSKAGLELAQWEPTQLGPASNGLLLAVLSMSYERERKLVQGGLDALEFASDGQRGGLLRCTLFCYPRQAYHAISLLSDLSDAIPEDMWLEVVTWCRRFLEEGWNSPGKSGGGMLLPFEFWGQIFPFVGAGSPVWERFAPILHQEARNPLKWQTDRRGFFVQYLLHAPVEVAKAAGRAMLQARLGDPVSRGYRFRILRTACERRKDLADELVPDLLRVAETPVQKWRLKAKPLGNGAAPEEERAAREQMLGSLGDFVKRISPGGVPQYPPQIDLEAYAFLDWSEEDSECLALVLQTIGNPGTDKSGVPCLLYLLQTLVARGPRVFAERDPRSLRWLARRHATVAGC